MTCKFNYRGISLNYKTYSELEDIATKIQPGKKLSQAKTVESLVRGYRSTCPSITEKDHYYDDRHRHNQVSDKRDKKTLR